jgi:hypothetical protein
LNPLRCKLKRAWRKSCLCHDRRAPSPSYTACTVDEIFGGDWRACMMHGASEGSGAHAATANVIHLSTPQILEQVFITYMHNIVHFI